MIIYSTRYYYAALTAGVMIAILGAIGVLGLNMPSAMNAVWFGYLFAALTTLGLNADLAGQGFEYNRSRFAGWRHRHIQFLRQL